MSRIGFVALIGAALASVILTGPCRADFPDAGGVKLQFSANFGSPNRNCGFGCNKIPWYLYFPVDPCTLGPNGQIMQFNQGLPANRFPHWPQSFPPPDAGQPGPQGYPGMSSRTFPNWPTPPYDPAGMRTQPVSCSANGQPSNIMLTGGSYSYAPGWTPYPAYPANWQPVYYYGR